MEIMLKNCIFSSQGKSLADLLHKINFNENEKGIAFLYNKFALQLLQSPIIINGQRLLSIDFKLTVSVGLPLHFSKLKCFETYMAKL